MVVTDEAIHFSQIRVPFSNIITSNKDGHAPDLISREEQDYENRYPTRAFFFHISHCSPLSSVFVLVVLFSSYHAHFYAEVELEFVLKLRK